MPWAARSRRTRRRAALCGASAFVLKKLIDKKKALGKRVQAEVDAQMAQQAEQAQ